MNKWFSLLIPWLVLSCIGKYKPNSPVVTVNPTIEPSVVIDADTLDMNLEKSKIEWVATEMRGTKRRTGAISFKDGLFLGKDGEIVGGIFTVAMETMDVTDIPVHEKTARKNILDHLKRVDFFKVAHYPVSTMKLTNVEKCQNDSLKISGNLTIRGVTRNIEFFAYHRDGLFTTCFTFNRLDWKIAYEGSWADKTLVDKEVELTIEILTE